MDLSKRPRHTLKNGLTLRFRKQFTSFCLILHNSNMVIEFCDIFSNGFSFRM